MQLVRFDLHRGYVRVHCSLEFTHLHELIHLVDSSEVRGLSTDTRRFRWAQPLVFEQFCRAWSRIIILYEAPSDEVLCRCLQMVQFAHLGPIMQNLVVHDSFRDPRERKLSVSEQIEGRDAYGPNIDSGTVRPLIFDELGRHEQSRPQSDF